MSSSFVITVTKGLHVLQVSVHNPIKTFTTSIWRLNKVLTRLVTELCFRGKRLQTSIIIDRLRNSLRLHSEAEIVTPFDLLCIREVVAKPKT